MAYFWNTQMTTKTQTVDFAKLSKKAKQTRRELGLPAERESDEVLIPIMEIQIPGVVNDFLHIHIVAK